MNPTLKHKGCSVANIVIVALAMTLHGTSAADPGTAEDRAALFDYLLQATLERTAFSPFKIGNIGPTDYASIEELVREESLKYRDEMIAADTDEELFLVLRKISNVRWDSHLHVYPVDGGLKFDAYKPGYGGKIEDRTQHAPLKFKPDFGDPADYRLFVSDFATDVAAEIGDVLVSVNGRPAADYLAELARYHGKSSRQSLWWDLAWSLPAKVWFVHSSLYDGDRISLGLQRANGEQYAVTSGYTRYDSVEWSGHDNLYTDIIRAEYIGRREDFAEQDEQRNAWKYPGYERIFSTPGYDGYVNDDRKAFLLQWNLFRGSIRDDVQQLLDYAQANAKLDYAIIWDGLNSRGGNYGVWMLQRLQARPFRTTFGNLRISDITEALAGDLRKSAVERVTEEGRHDDVVDVRQILQPDNGQFLIDWLDNDLAAAIADGQTYSNNVPFKNYYLPKYSDGIVYPAKVHFTGPLVLFLGPAGCSQVDQFASMVIDNDLGFSAGMPAGGCSNTWEWVEDLRFPSSGSPVARYMWTVGHTIRPNGEVMEGNSSPVDAYIPLTRGNYLDYYELLFEEAYRYIEEQRNH